MFNFIFSIAFIIFLFNTRRGEKSSTKIENKEQYLLGKTCRNRYHLVAFFICACIKSEGPYIQIKIRVYVITTLLLRLFSEMIKV